MKTFSKKTLQIFGSLEKSVYLCTRKTDKGMQLIFKMVPVVQLVRASDCGSECRRFESVRAPQKTSPKGNVFFCEQTQIKQIPASQVLAGIVVCK